MPLVFVINCLFMSLLFEALLASKLLYLPISFLACFYFSIYFKWRQALVICLVCATAQRELFQSDSLLAFLLIFTMAKTWKNQGDCSRAYVQWTAYAIAHFFAASTQLVLNNGFQLLKNDILHFLIELFSSLIVLSLSFPFFIAIMDFLADKFEIRKYTTTQREELLDARPR